MPADRLEYDSTGAGEFVRDGQAVVMDGFAGPGGDSRLPAAADSMIPAVGATEGGKVTDGAMPNGQPSGFARPGGTQGID